MKTLLVLTFIAWKKYGLITKEPVPYSVAKQVEEKTGMLFWSWNGQSRKRVEEKEMQEPGKEVPIIRQGAERGYPEWMYAYVHHLAYKEENHKEALPWALKAAEEGHLWSWHIIGDIYWDSKAVERNLPMP